jgi:2-hydroxy-6-oxonona-2,4-dienedioate hydrolase
MNTVWTELAGLDYSIRHVPVGARSTRVLETGAGTPLILMHGTGGHLEAYTRNLRALAARYRVIVYDYPGHGWSTPATADLEIDAYIEHLVGLMDALAIARAHLSGESLGGWVAVKFAARYPDRVERLMLNTPGGTMATPEVMERIRSLSQAAADDPSDERIRARLEWLMADPGSVTDELVAIRRGVYGRPGFARSMRHILCLQDPEIRRRNLVTDEELAAITAPTLVVWTSDDPSGPAKAGLDMAERIPGGEFKLIEKAGHWPQWEQAEVFNEIALEFLGRDRVKSIEAAAERLAASVHTGVTCPPVADLLGPGDVDAAYQVQRLLTERRVAAGARIVGRKIGLTSAAVQRQVGVDRPDFGTLFDDMHFTDGAEIPIGRLLQPRCEAEVAFVLGSDIDDASDPAAIRAAVALAYPALEIVDSRIAEWRIGITDTVADNASSGVFVLGATGTPLDAFDPVDVTMTMRRGGSEVVSDGTGRACLSDPLNALAWLATTMIEVGTPLRAGDVVLSGALGPLVPVAPGDVFTAEITPLGTVTASFSKEGNV